MTVAGLPSDVRGVETVSMVKEAGGQVVNVKVDVTKEADCDAIAQFALN